MAAPLIRPPLTSCKGHHDAPETHWHIPAVAVLAGSGPQQSATDIHLAKKKDFDSALVVLCLMVLVEYPVGLRLLV